MKIFIKLFSFLLGLALLAGPGCKQTILSPFFYEPGFRSSEVAVADLQIGPETGSTDSGEDSCSLEVNQAAKIIVLDVRVGPVLQSQSRDRYVKIELEVSIGLASGGQVLADTSGLPINGPGDYRLLLPIEYPKALTKGTNRVAIVALTRYLDGYGNLALPLGRQLRYCNLSW